MYWTKYIRYELQLRESIKRDGRSSSLRMTSKEAKQLATQLKTQSTVSSVSEPARFTLSWSSMLDKMDGLHRR
jgi:hypothetical protein